MCLLLNFEFYFKLVFKKKEKIRIVNFRNLFGLIASILYKKEIKNIFWFKIESFVFNNENRDLNELENEDEEDEDDEEDDEDDEEDFLDDDDEDDGLNLLKNIPGKNLDPSQTPQIDDDTKLKLEALLANAGM